MLLTGFVGRASTDGHVRLYQSLVDLRFWVELNSAGVLHSSVADSAQGRVMLWVRRTTNLTRDFSDQREARQVLQSRPSSSHGDDGLDVSIPTRKGLISELLHGDRGHSDLADGATGGRAR